MQILNWFFFEMLLIGYVEDSKTGMCFHYPEDLEWTVYIEVKLILKYVMIITYLSVVVNLLVLMKLYVELP